MTIYSHSYLGLGLMAAREAIFTRGSSQQVDSSSSSHQLASPCMPATATWAYNSRHFTIHPSQPSYPTCMIQVTPFTHIIWKSIKVPVFDKFFSQKCCSAPLTKKNLLLPLRICCILLVIYTTLQRGRPETIWFGSVPIFLGIFHLIWIWLRIPIY